jgi:UrcA family protein
MLSKIVVPALILAFAAFPARADTVSVHVAAGELASNAGAQAVYDRIAERAASVCDRLAVGIGGGASALQGRSFRAQCAADVTASLVRQTRNAEIAGIHARSGGARRIAATY